MVSMGSLKRYETGGHYISGITVTSKSIKILIFIRVYTGYAHKIEVRVIKKWVMARRSLLITSKI